MTSSITRTYGQVATEDHNTVGTATGPTQRYKTASSGQWVVALSDDSYGCGIAGQGDSPRGYPGQPCP
jgi:hypothetical protein